MIPADVADIADLIDIRWRTTNSMRRDEILDAALRIWDAGYRKRQPPAAPPAPIARQ